MGEQRILRAYVLFGWELKKGIVMRKSFKDSLKALEADIQHANTLYVLTIRMIKFVFGA